MPRSKRPEPDLPPGPARDLVDLFRRLRDSSQLRIGQIASRTGYAPGHVSEVLRGWKAPSPDAAARIAQVLGADDTTVRRARRRAEDLKEWKRENSRNRKRTSAPETRPGYPGQHALEIELARAIVHYATVEGRRDIADRLLDILGVAVDADIPRLPMQHKLRSLDVTLHIIVGNPRSLPVAARQALRKAGSVPAGHGRRPWGAAAPHLRHRLRQDGKRPGSAGPSGGAVVPRPDEREVFLHVDRHL